MTHQAPYSAETRAKGWRFELDHERIRQSDTWALCQPEYRPWLLMLWMVAWEQTPCGSMPDSDDLICARIGMAPKLFQKAKPSLMRGWTLAGDGRLYHRVITERVLEMIERRRKDAERRGRSRGKSPDSDGSPDGVPRDNLGTDNTGTGTGTGTIDSVGDARPADVCIALKAAGLVRTNPSHPTLAKLLAGGATVAMFVDAAESAKGKRDPFAYLLAVVEGQLQDAGKPAPKRRNTQEALEAANNAVVERFLKGGADATQ